jgi:hypothetical protein
MNRALPAILVSSNRLCVSSSRIIILYSLSLKSGLSDKAQFTFWISFLSGYKLC